MFGISAFMTVVLGAACLALGLWGAAATWPLMRQALTVLALSALTLGGALAVLIGISEMIDGRQRRQRAASPAKPTSQRP